MSETAVVATVPTHLDRIKHQIDLVNQRKMEVEPSVGRLLTSELELDNFLQQQHHPLQTDFHKFRVQTTLCPLGSTISSEVQVPRLREPGTWESHIRMHLAEGVYMVTRFTKTYRVWDQGQHLIPVAKGPPRILDLKQPKLMSHIAQFTEIFGIVDTISSLNDGPNLWIPMPAIPYLRTPLTSCIAPVVRQIERQMENGASFARRRYSFHRGGRISYLPQVITTSLVLTGSSLGSPERGIPTDGHSAMLSFLNGSPQRSQQLS